MKTEVLQNVAGEEILHLGYRKRAACCTGTTISQAQHLHELQTCTQGSDFAPASRADGGSALIIEDDTFIELSVKKREALSAFQPAAT